MGGVLAGDRHRAWRAVEEGGGHNAQAHRSPYLQGRIQAARTHAHKPTERSPTTTTTHIHTNTQTRRENLLQ